MFAGLRKKWRDQIGQTKTILGEKVREALASVVPITLIVLILCFTAAPVPTDVLLAFLVGAVLLIVGMGLFTLGADTAMLPIGERVGAQMTKSRKLWVVVCVSLLIGIIVTISEPDLQVLAGQVPGIPNAVLIGAVAVGVGIFLVVALLRILFQIPLNGLLIASYIVIFTLAAFAPKDFLAVAFDSGGVTTGPMTVPFIMALGLGVSSTRSDGKAGEDSFGLVALCSVGPVLAVLTLALAYPAAGSYVPSVVPEAGDSRELWRLFAQGLPVYAKEMGAALVPIAAFFAVFQVTSLHLPRKNVLKITVGLLYTYIGLVLFMTGVNVGFLPAGSYLGRQIAALEQSWVLIPIGMLMGWFIVQAEPAVHVLNRQVEELTSGAIPGKAMSTSLSIGVAVSIGLAMLRVLTGVSIFVLLVPGYLCAIGLSFVVPKIFTAIAFDSGGVASGPMTATFLLPFAMGACETLGGNVVTDAFGVVAMVALTPLITIPLLGLVYQLKLKKAAADAPAEPGRRLLRLVPGTGGNAGAHGSWPWHRHHGGFRLSGAGSYGKGSAAVYAAQPEGAAPESSQGPLAGCSGPRRYDGGAGVQHRRRVCQKLFVTGGGGGPHGKEIDPRADRCDRQSGRYGSGYGRSPGGWGYRRHGGPRKGDRNGAGEEILRRVAGVGEGTDLYSRLGGDPEAHHEGHYGKGRNADRGPGAGVLSAGHRPGGPAAVQRGISAERELPVGKICRHKAPWKTF